MQRPVMDPTFVYDAPKAKPKRRRKPVGWVIAALRFFLRVLTLNPFGLGRNFRVEDGTPAQRFIRGLIYRLAFVPVVLVMFVIAIVLAATHPKRLASNGDPLSAGIYYDPVNLVADDGARLEGWLVPVMDAKKVLEERELVLNRRQPAVILVHDVSATRQQLLPLVAPLHESGFIVLALNLRGAGSFSRDAQTFGVKEALDVKAAVEMLRRRAFVDPSKIAVIGVGTGANAALIAAKHDPALPALVLADPVDGFDQAFANRIGANHKWLPPLRPLFKWTFQIMYGVDVRELDMANYTSMMQSRPVLVTDARSGLMLPANVRGIQAFLLRHCRNQAVVAVK
jgi:pimeloyl-ACP methyl ester carboxylesterase